MTDVEQDEVRVGQRGTITPTWAEKGTRPRIKRQQQFEYAYIFGAVCPCRDESVGLVLPTVNTRSMLKHLEEISKVVPKGRHAVVVLDQAAWHTTANVRFLIIYLCFRCHQHHLHSILSNRYGNSCGITGWQIGFLMATIRLLMPVATPGTGSLTFPIA